MGTIESLSDYRSSCKGNDLHLRRLAIQIAAQLPEDLDEALEALDLAKELVRSFMGAPALS